MRVEDRRKKTRKKIQEESKLYVCEKGSEVEAHNIKRMKLGLFYEEIGGKIDDKEEEEKKKNEAK